MPDQRASGVCLIINVFAPAVTPVCRAHLISLLTMCDVNDNVGYIILLDAYVGIIVTFRSSVYGFIGEISERVIILLRNAFTSDADNCEKKSARLNADTNPHKNHELQLSSCRFD